MYVPQRRRDGVLELECPRSAVDLKRHHVDTGVVELHPGQILSVGTEPEGAALGQDLFLVHPVGDTVEHRAGFTWQQLHM